MGNVYPGEVKNRAVELYRLDEKTMDANVDLRKAAGESAPYIRCKTALICAAP